MGHQQKVSTNSKKTLYKFLLHVYLVLKGFKNLVRLKQSVLKKLSVPVSINLKSCSLAIRTAVVISISLYRLYVDVSCRGPSVVYATFVFGEAVVLYATCFGIMVQKIVSYKTNSIICMKLYLFQCVFIFTSSSNIGREIFREFIWKPIANTI
jgi:hypothetical protein